MGRRFHPDQSGSKLAEQWREETMEQQRMRELAAAAGLTKLDDKHMSQLAQGAQTTQGLIAKLPKDLHWSEEMALVFRLPSPAEAKP